MASIRSNVSVIQAQHTLYVLDAYIELLNTDFNIYVNTDLIGADVALVLPKYGLYSGETHWLRVTGVGGYKIEFQGNGNTIRVGATVVTATQDIDYSEATRRIWWLADANIWIYDNIML